MTQPRKAFVRHTPGRPNTIGPESGHPLAGPFTQAEIDRFYAKVEKTDGCWLWRGSIAKKTGYGRFFLRDYVYFAHRVALAFTGVKIPIGRIVDHTCRNAGCVSPAHLRVVDSKTSCTENTTSPIALNAAKTHCTKCGSPLSGPNVARILVHYRKNSRGNPCDRWGAARYCLTYHPSYHGHPRRFWLPEDMATLR